MVDGTSFSTPTVAGTAALLKAARPGLTVAQYRSLLINSASPIKFGGVAAGVQQAGAGSLNAGAALLATAAVYPTSLSFGTGGAFPQGTLTLQVTNTGTAADAFTVNTIPTGAAPAPALSSQSLQLDAGASASLTVTMIGSNLAPGGYEGYLSVSGANGKVVTSVPYWYGVTSNTPVQITDIDSDTRGTRNTTAEIDFRVTDAAGVPITAVVPTVTVITGAGAVQRLTSEDSSSPGVFAVTVRLGRLAGTNTFRVTAGNITADFNITGH